MSSFMGGSAYAMANQIGEGYILMSAATLKRLQVPEVKQLEFEIDKLQREVRAETVATEDQAAVQKRNRKLGRLNQAMLIIRGYYEQKLKH